MVGKGGDDEQAAQGLGFPGFATKNTTRVGGADPIADAAGVAQAVYPARSRDTRPAAVTLVDAKDWQAAISAAQLMSRPLRAPVLLSDGEDMPDATKSALDALDPTGAPKAGDAEVIRIGKTAKVEGAKTTDVEGADPAALAQAIDKLHTAAAGQPSSSVVVAPSSAPEYAMPAAAWAAKAGDPVLWSRQGQPARRHQGRHHRPPAPAHLRARARLGDLRRGRQAARRPRHHPPHLRRRPGGQLGRLRALQRREVRLERGRPRPRAGVRQQVAAGRRGGRRRAVGRRGPTARCWSTPTSTSSPSRSRTTCSTSSPATTPDPVRGVYNHGWIMGDEKAISVDVQSRIDALLEIQPVQASS